MPPNSIWRPDPPQPPVGPKLPIPTGGSQPPFINRQLAGVLAIIVAAWPSDGQPAPIQPEQTLGVRVAKIAPLTLAYGSQPPPNGPYVGAFERQTRTIIFSWPQDQEPHPLQPSQTLGVRRGLIAPLTLTYGQQPPIVSDLPCTPLSVILGQWPDKWWPPQTAPPNAAWNVPPPDFVPTPPDQPQVVAAWQPPWTPPQVAPKSVPVTQAGPPPPAPPLSPQNLAILGQAWVPAAVSEQPNVPVAAVIPVVVTTQPFVPYPINIVRSWINDLNRPPVPVSIAPLTLSYGDQPPKTGPIEGSSSNLSTITQAWQPAWIEPPFLTEVAPVIPVIAAPLLSSPQPPAILSSWFVDSTTIITTVEGASLIAPAGDSIPAVGPLGLSNLTTIVRSWITDPFPPPRRNGVAAITAIVIVPPVLPPFPQPHIAAQWPAIWWPAQSAPKSIPLTRDAPPPPVQPISFVNLSIVEQAWIPPWIEPPWPVEVAPVIPTTIVPILAPPPQPHIAAQWPALWWPDQSEPFATPLTQGDQPPKRPPLSIQTQIIEAQWPAIWWPSQTSAPVAALIPLAKTPFIPYPISVIRRWDTPWYSPPIPPVVVAPLTLVYGQQPPKNGPMGGAEDVENQLAINQWPAIWWPPQRAPFGAAELFVIPPFLPIPPVTKLLIVSLWPQPEALPKGTTLTPAWHLGLPFQPAYDQRIIYRQIRNFTAGERFDVIRTIPNIQSGRRLVKAWLTIKIAVDDPDNEAVIQKVITTTPVCGLGWISDDGSSDSTGQVIFQLMETDTALLGYRHIYTYDIQLEFGNGEIATKEIGDIALLQRLTNANS